MSYLKFDRAFMINLEESLKREILRTNRSGAYHCVTIVGCNTRKYHGLLVAPVPSIDEDNHVFLSSLDETVVQHEAEFNLGIHYYGGNNFNPSGHKYIKELDLEDVPSTIFRVGGVMLSKEIIFTTFEDRVIIKYTLMDAHSPTVLKFRPFLAFRNVNNLTFENQFVNKSYVEQENGIKTSMYEGYPDLHMQFSKKCDFVFQPDWYKGIEYPKERERGFPCKEDLYVPGYFSLPIEKGESVYFCAGMEAVQVDKISELFQNEVERRTPRNSFFNCLKNSAKQFYFRPTPEDGYLLAGYPWFKVRARDLFIATPGCTLTINEDERYERILNTSIRAYRDFMQNGRPDKVITEIDLPDVPLWAVWCIQQFAKEKGLELCNEKYGTFVKEIIDYVKNNKHPNLILESNGLLYSDGRSKAVTWMNSTVDGKPIVPRSGYIVEFNALWYNALKFASSLSLLRGEKTYSEDLESWAKKCANSFVGTFLNDSGYLFDYVDGDRADWSVRPNMLFAVALDYSPLDKKQKRNVLNILTRELLTPKGIRTLSPKSSGYRPYYVGSQRERDLSYHQGTAWPWLLGFYLEAYIKIYKESGIYFVERNLIGVEEEMNTHCIGSLSELYDGNPPFESRGAISFAMNVSAILRILKVMETYNFE